MMVMHDDGDDYNGDHGMAMIMMSNTMMKMIIMTMLVIMMMTMLLMIVAHCKD